MNRLTGWLLSCSLVLAAILPGQAAVPTAFRVFAPLHGTLPPHTPVRVHLSREVIAAARPGFIDLRLFDEQAVETPYVVYPQRSPPSHTVLLRVLAYSQEQEVESIVLQGQPQRGPVQALLVQTSARDFHKLVRLQVSHDQVAWSEVAQGELFDFSSRLDLRQTTLTCPPVTAPYLRLLLQDAAPARSDRFGFQLRYEGLELVTGSAPPRPFRIDQISARIGPFQATDALYDQASITPSMLPSPTPGQTWFALGGLNLPLTQLTLNAANPYFHRRVEVWAAERDHDEAYQQVADGVIYKLPGVATAETTLRVPARTYAYMRLKILQGDNPPLRLQSVDIAWARHYLYFVPAAGRRYSLAIGNAQVQSPVYELQALLPAQQAEREAYPLVELGTLQPQAHYRPSPAPSAPGQIARLLLTALVLLLAVGLAWWAYRLLKVVAKSGDA